jgi:RNA polymerase sigma-70 factor (ECF subfamily)
MGTFEHKSPGDPADLLEPLRGGDRRALATLFDHYRDRLRRMVELGLDPRLRARIDASDVVQDGYLDVARDLDAYLADPKLPPLLWVRLHAGRRLTTMQRQNLAARLGRRGAGDIERSRRPARGQLRRIGVDAHGLAQLCDAGGPGRRADAARAGGAE